MYLILKNPFFPRHKRRIYYYLIIGSIVFCLTTMDTLHYWKSFKVRGAYDIITDDLVIDTPDIDYYARLGFAAIDIIFLVKINWRLNQPGTNKGLRKKVFYRYSLFAIIYLIRFLPSLLL